MNISIMVNYFRNLTYFVLKYYFQDADFQEKKVFLLFDYCFPLLERLI